MAYELIIIGGGIAFGLIGFIIGALLVHRAYKSSPSINHYQRIIDILTLRKLRNKSDGLDIPLNTAKDHIKHYENIRDKLTVRQKPEVIETSGGGVGMLGNLIGGFIVILVGVMLIPAVTQQVSKASQSSGMNVTTWGSTVLTMVPAFFIIGLIGIIVAIVASQLRNVGLV